MANHSAHPVPSRIFHLINLLCMIILIYTGAVIHWPDQGSNLGLMRYLHFVAAFVILVNLVVRIYYAFLGRERDGGNFAIRGKDIVEIPKVIAYYLFLRRDHYKEGIYNPLQKMGYLGVVLLILFQALTGLGLMWPDSSFGFIVSMVGGLGALRAIHAFMTYIFVAFVIVHVYLVVTEALEELAPMFFLKGRKDA